jgi:hypothetical protein
MNHINSPMPKTGDEMLEEAIKRVGADVAPRVTPADIKMNIAAEYYFTAGDGVSSQLDFVAGYKYPGPLDLLTFCVLVLKNGFTVTGESACASPANFNPEIGKRIARENAVAKMWPLMGYALRQHLHNMELVDAQIGD